MSRSPVSRMCAAASVAFLISCGEARTTTPATGDPAGTAPITAVVLDELGFDLVDVQSAVDRARFDHTARCLSDRGLEIREEAPPLRIDDFDPRDYAGSAARRLREGSVSQLLPTEGGSTDGDAEYSRAAQECTDEANAAIVDPSAELRTWIRGVAAELATTVDADQRVIDATAARDACLTDADSSLGAVSAAEDATISAAEEILDSYRAGISSQDAAESALLSLAEKDAAALVAPYACIDAWLDTYAAVQAEAESAHLEDHGDELQAELARSREAIVAFMTSVGAAPAGSTG